MINKSGINPLQVKKEKLERELSLKIDRVREEKLDKAYMIKRNMFKYTKNKKEEKKVLDELRLIFDEIYPLRVSLGIFNRGKEEEYFDMVVSLLRDEKDKYRDDARRKVNLEEIIGGIGVEGGI